MRKVAVVAHSRKSFGGGLRELREVLTREGVTDPLWYEVKKSRHAPEYARRAVTQGVDVIFVWGGDGMVQRCIDAAAGDGRGGGDPACRHGEPPGDEPGNPRRSHRSRAGGIARGPPPDGHRVGERRAFHGDGRCGFRRPHDQRRRPGHEEPPRSHGIPLHGTQEPQRTPGEGHRGGGRQAFFRGPCLLRTGRERRQDTRRSAGFPGGAAGRRAPRIRRGHREEPAPSGPGHLLRLALGRAGASPFVEVTRGKKIRISFNRKLPYELDGGARPAVRELQIKVRPGAIKICVPAKAMPVSAAAAGDEHV